MAEENLGKAVAKGAVEGAVKASIYHAVMVWVIPVGLPAVTAYLGYLQGLPWMYMAVGAGLMFGGVTSGLVRFDEWRERRRIEGKLHFLEFRVVRATDGHGLVLGVGLKSEADIRIEVDFSEVRTTLGNTIPKLREYKKTRFVVEPREGVFFDDHPIETAIPTPGTLEANLDFRIKYGPVGNPKYTLTVKKRATLPFDQNGAPRGNPVVYEAA